MKYDLFSGTVNYWDGICGSYERFLIDRRKVYLRLQAVVILIIIIKRCSHILGPQRKSSNVIFADDVENTL